MQGVWAIRPWHAYWAGLLAVSILYVSVFGWMLASTDLLPYVTDNNESFSVLWHSFNLYNFDFFTSFGLTDEASSPSAAAHPFAHTHQGNWPRIFGFVIFALGAQTVESQILVTTATIGVAAFFFCYHFFARNTGPFFAALFCAFLMTDYVLYTQWHVVTYRVWQLFFIFSSLLCAEGMGSERKGLWGGLTILNYACLFYYEMVFAAFAAGIAGLYTIALYWRHWKQLATTVACQVTGATLGLSILVVQLLGYYGLENFKKDIWFTFFSRNYAIRDPGLMGKIIEFYRSQNIAFWYNIQDGSVYLKPIAFVRSFFSYDFQTHTPRFTALMLAMLLPIAGLFLSPSKRALEKGGRLGLVSFALTSIAFAVLVALLAYGLVRGAGGIALLAGALAGCVFLLATYRLSYLGQVVRLPTGLLRAVDGALALLVVLSFMLLAMALSSQDAASGLPHNGSWVRNRGILEISGGIIAGVAALAFLKVVLGHGLVRIPSGARANMLVAAALVFCLGALIRFQHEFYDQSYQLLWQELAASNLPLEIVKITIFIAALLGAMLVISYHNAIDDKFWEPVRCLRAYILCGFLAYVVVYGLAAGYVHTGYLYRSTPFTVFLTNAILATSVYIPLRFAYLAFKSGKTIGLCRSYVPGGMAAVVVVIAATQWIVMQLRYINMLPPDHYSFLKELAKEPYKGKSFAVGNYHANVAAYTGQWAYMDFKMANGAYRETDDGIQVDRDLRYLWMADRDQNPEYLTPDYYICMSNQSLSTIVSELANGKDGVSNAIGCDRMVRSFQIGTQDITQRLKHRVVAFDENGLARRGWMSWAIVQLDWNYPPILRKMEGTSIGRPVLARVIKDGGDSRLNYEYHYFHQEGELEGQTEIQLLRFGENSQCTNDPSRVTVLEKRIGAGKGSFRIPQQMSGKFGVRVMPVGQTKSADRWYYSYAISIPGSPWETPAVCPVNIVDEPPQTLTAERKVGSEVEVKWSGVIDAAQYEIDMADEGQPWRLAVSASPLQHRHIIRGISPERSYRFRIRGCDLDHICTRYSQEITAEPPVRKP